MLETMQVGGEQTTEIIRREIQALEMPMRVAKQVAIMNIVAGALVVFTATLVFLLT